MHPFVGPSAFAPRAYAVPVFAPPRTPRPLAGRQAELSVTHEVLTGRTSAPPVLLVAGEAGIGKSRLMTAAVDSARADGVSVLTAACLPLTEAAPLLPVADILRMAHDVDGGEWLRTAAGNAPDYVPATISRLLPELTPVSPHTDAGDSLWRQRLFIAVRLVLGELAALRPLALVLEDAHWSDSSTLDLLDHLLHAGDGPPAPLVVTYRSEDTDVSDVNAAWFARASRSSRTSSLELGRLTQAETVEQVALATGSVDPALAASLFSRSEGNPLFTEQLLDSHGRLPVDLRSVFDAKLSRLRADELTVLKALAVVGRPLPARLVGQLLDDDIDLAASLRELRSARLLRSDHELVMLRHALLADAILADLPGDEAARLSGRVAEAMQGWPEHGSSGEIAEHWQRAGDARNELQWRIRAAENAYATHANHEAVHQWLRVIAVWDEVPDAEEIAGRPLHEVYLTADWAVFDAGMTRQSVELIDAALARFSDAAPIVVASLLRRQSRNLSWSNPSLAISRIEECQALFEASEPVPEWIFGLSDLADARRAQGRFVEALAAAEKGLEVAETCGARSMLRRMHACRALAQHGLGDLDGVADTLRALAAAPEPDTLRERTVVATRHSDLLLAMGHYPEVPAVTGDLLHLIAQFGASGSRLATVLRGNAAEALLLLGRVSDAASPDVLGAQSQSTNEHLTDIQQGELILLNGEIDAADSYLTDLAARWRDSPDWTPALWSTRAEVAAWAGDPNAALSHATAGLRVSTDNDLARTAGWLLLQAARACADLALTQSTTDREQGLSQLDALRSSVAVDDPLGARAPSSGPALLATWNAERARLRGSGDPAAWDRAATEWYALGARFRSAYCRWRQAEAILASRSRDPAAATALNTAAELAAGHVPLARAIEKTAVRARISLQCKQPQTDAAPVVQPPDHDYGLTERELAVLKLVGQGHTNAQIGAELFMSPKTASVHVTNILRKLGVTTRTQAAAVAERAGLLS